MKTLTWVYETVDFGDASNHLTQCTTGKHYLYIHGHKLKHAELGKVCVTTR